MTQMGTPAPARVYVARVAIVERQPYTIRCGGKVTRTGR